MLLVHLTLNLYFDQNKKNKTENERENTKLALFNLISTVDQTIAASHFSLPEHLLFTSLLHAAIW